MYVIVISGGRTWNTSVSIETSSSLSVITEPTFILVCANMWNDICVGGRTPGTGPLVSYRNNFAPNNTFRGNLLIKSRLRTLAQVNKQQRHTNVFQSEQEIWWNHEPAQRVWYDNDLTSLILKCWLVSFELRFVHSGVPTIFVALAEQTNCEKIVHLWCQQKSSGLFLLTFPAWATCMRGLLGCVMSHTALCYFDTVTITIYGGFED